MSLDWIDTLPRDGVYTLRGAQSSLLQVLLSDFHLTRNDTGFSLQVTFDEDTQAIRTREAKETVKERMPEYPDEVESIQGCIDSVIFRGGRDYRFSRPGFAFRYASGGTLPVFEIRGVEYFCLFYRDVFPVGWNIANGACDSLPELLNPKRAIGRELLEELIILDISHDRPHDHVPTWATEGPINVPEFVDARRLASNFLADELDIARDFARNELDVDWNVHGADSPRGPDTLRVDFAGNSTVQGGLYLNINARDFGIELDRIAKMQLQPDWVLLDGEINDNRILNRPIGLFEVHRTQEAVYDGATEFLPDKVFYKATLELDNLPSRDELLQLIEGKFLQHLSQTGIRKKKKIKQWRDIGPEHQLDLCPVTRQIIRRHMGATRPFVFISYTSSDCELAERIQHDLRNRGMKVWRDASNLNPVARADDEIQGALDNSTHVVVVASDAIHNSDWVKMEIQYANDTKKAGIALLAGARRPLPIGLTRWRSVDFTGDYGSAIEELVTALTIVV